MKILALADVESKALWDYYNPERLKELDDKGYAEYTAMQERQKSSKQKEPER